MEDGSANNGDSVYEVAVEDDGSTPPAEEVSALKREVESLYKELKGSKSTIAALESQIEGYEKDRAVAAQRIEQLQGEAQAMGAVAARASELEGDVARLQHDLVSAMSESEENAAEAAAVRKALEGLEAEKSALRVAVTTLEEKVDALASEKEKVEAKVAERENQIRNLQFSVTQLEEAGRKENEARGEEAKALLNKLDALLKDVDAKEAQVAQAKKLASDAMLEADALRSSLEDLRKLGGTNGVREIEIEVEDEKGIDMDWKRIVTTAAVPTATAVIVGAAICYLHYSRRR